MRRIPIESGEWKKVPTVECFCRCYCLDGSPINFHSEWVKKYYPTHTKYVALTFMPLNTRTELFDVLVGVTVFQENLVIRVFYLQSLQLLKPVLILFDEHECVKWRLDRQG
ncbi:hypothetical protein WH87_02920 [Devosia epidermidihirudinis]|uniref:Uncharacterized protein n=1 Tax=Devosia epidermidihirudinis TaxID=1293439 RepID=A0A0F5QJ58_9HYPH|nr:hypothetical protein WH87_02920 [Devosia epidermidihirudinis]